MKNFIICGYNLGYQNLTTIKNIFEKLRETDPKRMYKESIHEYKIFYDVEDLMKDLLKDIEENGKH